MGDRKIITILSMLFIITIIPFTANNAFADYSKTITAEDLGVLQLAAHDLFNVDRGIPQDFENGKLDLSTLFEDTLTGNSFNDDIIAIGGEHRNRENIMLFTVASNFGETYVNLKEKHGEDTAKQIVIEMYHEKLTKTYQKTFHESFPDPMDGEATMTENLALRTIHDFLPGQIRIDKEFISTLDPALNGLKLDKQELKQKSSKLDGELDMEFRTINICFPPDDFPCIMIDLLERDQSFGDEFMTDYSFNFFLGEIEDGQYDKNDKVMIEIRNLMAKGISF